MKKISRIVASFVLLASFSLPVLVVAQDTFVCPAGQTANVDGICVSNFVGSSGGGINTSYLQGYKESIIGVINNLLVPVLIAIAFIVFLWGVYKYFIYGADSDTEREKGRQFVLWGIIGFVIITAIWGVVNIVKDTLIPSTVKTTAPNPPTI